MSTLKNEYYLSLGSDLGDKIGNIKKALHFLQILGKILKISSLFETEPVGMEAGADDFLNLVLCLEAPFRLSPFNLLKKIKKFEEKMGRDIAHSHNLSRSIDIDILLAGNQIIDTEELTIPHQEMTKRAFVLVPLKEIAPDLIHPVLKKPVTEILANLDAQSKKLKVKKVKTNSI